MTTAIFDYTSVVRNDLPPPAAQWKGFPRHNFIGGHNAPESIPTDHLVEAARRVLSREAPTLAMYGLHSGPQGYRPLREFLAAKLKRQAGIECSSDEILMTSGSLQAIDLVNTVLLSAGDTVIAEQSNYGGCLTRWARAGVSVVAIPLDQDGMRTDILEQELERLKSEGIRPKYIYTIPTVQNPTASIMPLERRRELLRVAEKYDLPIFEDECYSDLVWSGDRPPALYALDNTGRVIFTGSFSKSIAPALRVGYLVAPWDFLSRALACKTDAGSASIEQMILAEYCPEHFDRHVEKLNRLLEKKLDVLIEALNEHFGTSVEFARPPGGIFLWLRLPEEVDTTRLTQVAGAEGIAVNPGVEWSKDHPKGNRHIRVCYASASPEEIRTGIKALADVCHNEFGVPLRSANQER
ncbi:MAG: PLP-dependent aminotransferase family protein [Alphaproteobacteria bacterium]|nr:PLP-dependent aminotransferase family protein [Alphaproteobacteria bacterium]